MAIVVLTTETEKGTKKSIDINYFPIRKRYSPGIVLKKGAKYSEENKLKNEMFMLIVNEWEWLLLNASPQEVERVYNLKAGEETRNLYKGVSLKDILNDVRGENRTSKTKIGDKINGGFNDISNTTDEIDFFEFYKQQHVKRKPHDIYQTILNKVRVFHGSEGALPLKDITKQWAKNFLAYLQRPTKKHPNPKESSTTIYFNHVRTILQEAVEQDLIPFNALSLIPKKERPKNRRSDADSLTFEEIEKLTKVEKPRIGREGQQMFLFSCFTGLRVSDCITLKWNQIYSIEENEEVKFRIRVKQIKTQARVNKPLSDSALTILEQRRIDAKESAYKSEYVFPSYCPDKVSIACAKKNINIQLKRWGKQAGIDHRMHFHLARHTYATMLLEQGNDISVVQQLLGHKDIRATMIYAHVSSGIKEKAVGSLPKIGSTLLQKKPVVAKSTKSKSKNKLKTKNRNSKLK